MRLRRHGSCAKARPGGRLRLHTALLPAAALALALSGGQTADGQGQIVIQGAESGSHLRLTVNNDRILVDGLLARGQPIGCNLIDPLQSAACPTSGADSIQVVMGPSDDKVEVLDPLPVPLTVYLGKGSDKLIGNGEADTCYPQGTRRNRCIGGGGNDVCITGPRNSDCVGGPGADYCLASTGSDGCWGGPGNDVCRMGRGNDGCHGDAGNDRLYEGAGRGKLYGGAGRDYCDGGPGVGRSYDCEAGPRK
jgi:Ca2+-binding RTX toxin-like protein